MSTMERLLRTGGAWLAAGALLSATATGADALVDKSTANAPMLAFGTVGIVGGLVMLLGLPTWYAVQAGRAGRLGAVGFVMTFLGWAGLQVGTAPLFTYVAPAIYARPGDAELAEPGALDTIGTGFGVYVIATLLLLNLGILLFGIATVRARAFPRPLGWVILLGPPAIMVPPIEAVATCVLLVAIGACGFLVATGRVTVPVPQRPEPAQREVTTL
jgi:hypothetical protein